MGELELISHTDQLYQRSGLHLLHHMTTMDFYGCLAGLASLSSESLNQFTENIANAEALSTEVASIYRGLPDTAQSAIGTELSQFGGKMAKAKHRNDAPSIPLLVFELSKNRT